MSDAFIEEVNRLIGSDSKKDKKATVKQVEPESSSTDNDFISAVNDILKSPAANVSAQDKSDISDILKSLGSGAISALTFGGTSGFDPKYAQESPWWNLAGEAAGLAPFALLGLIPGMQPVAAVAGASRLPRLLRALQFIYGAGGKTIPGVLKSGAAYGAIRGGVEGLQGWEPQDSLLGNVKDVAGSSALGGGLGAAGAAAGGALGYGLGNVAGRAHRWLFGPGGVATTRPPLSPTLAGQDIEVPPIDVGAAVKSFGTTYDRMQVDPILQAMSQTTPPGTSAEAAQQILKEVTRDPNIRLSEIGGDVTSPKDVELAASFPQARKMASFMEEQRTSNITGRMSSVMDENIGSLNALNDAYITSRDAAVKEAEGLYDAAQISPNKKFYVLGATLEDIDKDLASDISIVPKELQEAARDKIQDYISSKGMLTDVFAQQAEYGTKFEHTSVTYLHNLQKILSEAAKQPRYAHRKKFFNETSENIKNILSKKMPVYAEARKLWNFQEEQERLFEAGRDAILSTSEKTSKPIDDFLKNFNEIKKTGVKSEKQLESIGAFTSDQRKDLVNAAQAGVRQGLEDVIETTGIGQNAATELLNKLSIPRSQKLINDVFAKGVPDDVLDKMKKAQKALTPPQWFTKSEKTPEMPELSTGIPLSPTGWALFGTKLLQFLKNLETFETLKQQSPSTIFLQYPGLLERQNLKDILRGTVRQYNIERGLREGGRRLGSAVGAGRAQSLFSGQ